MTHFEVIEATRSEGGVVIRVWIVKRRRQNFRVAISLLFETREAAEAEATRLKGMDANNAQGSQPLSALQTPTPLPFW